MLYFRTTMIVILCVLLLFQLFRLFEYYPSKIFFPIYVIVVTAMMISSTLRYERTVDKSFYMIRIGSLLYGISNAVLLFFKFRFTRYNNGDNINLIAMVIIVLLYYVAQYLIAHGSLYHKKGET
jgi:tryptophan-rich sensory protein